MTCICGHSRSWHRTREVVRLVRYCHSWDCRCTRFLPAPDDDPEPPAPAFGHGPHIHRGAA